MRAETRWTHETFQAVPFEVLNHAFDAQPGAHQVGVSVEQKDRHLFEQSGQEVYRRDRLRSPEAGADRRRALRPLFAVAGPVFGMQSFDDVWSLSALEQRSLAKGQGETVREVKGRTRR